MPLLSTPAIQGLFSCLNCLPSESSVRLLGGRRWERGYGEHATGEVLIEQACTRGGVGLTGVRRALVGFLVYGSPFRFGVLAEGAYS